MVVERSRQSQVARLSEGLSLIALIAGVPTCGTPAEDGLRPAASNTASTGRLLGIDVSSADGEDFDAACELARQAGMQFTSCSIAWGEIERLPGEFAPDPNWLAIANDYRPGAGRAAGPDDRTDRTPPGVRLPDELQGRVFDDPQAIACFERLLD